MNGRTDYPKSIKHTILDKDGNCVGYLYNVSGTQLHEYDQTEIGKFYNWSDDTQGLTIIHGPNGHGEWMATWFELKDN